MGTKRSMNLQFHLDLFMKRFQKENADITIFLSHICKIFTFSIKCIELKEEMEMKCMEMDEFMFLSYQRYTQCLRYPNDDHSHFISDIFRKKKNVRFLKNFLRGNQCGHCFVRNKKLRICKGCGRQYYCSKLCQKRHWIKHKINCKK